MAKYDKADIERRMSGAVESLKGDLAGLRTGRANTALLDPVTVEVYGSMMPLNQVATVSAPEPRLLSVQVWDRSNMTPVEKGIARAGLGLNAFQHAVELDPKFAAAHMNIGAMALTYRDYENAEKSLKLALAQDDNSPEGHLYLAWALDGQRGRDPKKGTAAGAEFERYLTFRPDSPDAICGAGWAYTAEKPSYQKAISFLEKCKTAPITDSTQQQLIDAKVKGLKAILASGQPAPAAAPEPKKEAPKANAGGTSVLDQAVKAAEQQEQAAPADGAQTPPADGTQAPANNGAPAPAPTPAPQQ